MDVLVTLVALFTLRTMVATTIALVLTGAHWNSLTRGKTIRQSGTQEDVEFADERALDGGAVVISVTVFVLVICLVVVLSVEFEYGAVGGSI